MMVRPATTFESTDSPLYAATVRVVRLLAAAIDQSVSPGLTVWGSAAPAGVAATASGAATISAASARGFKDGLPVRPWFQKTPALRGIPPTTCQPVMVMEPRNPACKDSYTARSSRT